MPPKSPRDPKLSQPADSAPEPRPAAALESRPKRPARPPRRRSSSAPRRESAPPSPPAPRWALGWEVFRGNFFGLALAGAVATLVSYGFCLLIPEVYQASATIALDPAIRPGATLSLGEEGGSGGPPAADPFNILSVPTIQRLLKQPDNAARLKEAIALAGKLEGEAPENPETLAERTCAALAPEDLETLAREAGDYAEATIEGISKSLRVDSAVEKKLAFDVIYSPFLFLQAKANSAEAARALANCWAASFALAFEDMSRRQTADNIETVRAEYERAFKALQATQADMRRLQTEGSIDIAEARLEAQALARQSLAERAANAETLLEAGRQRVKELRAREAWLANAEGAWIGDASAAADAPTTPASPAAEEASPENEPLYRSLRSEALRSARSLAQARAALREFDAAHSLGELRARLEAAESRRADASRRASLAGSEAPALAESLRRLEERIAGTSRTLRLSEPGQHAQREEINPEWLALVGSASRLREELDRLAPEAEHQAAASASASAEAEPLRGELAALEARREELSAERTRLEARAEKLRDDFQELRLDLIDAAEEATSHALELRALKRVREEADKTYFEEAARFQEVSGGVAALESRAEVQQAQVRMLQARLQELETRLAGSGRELRIASPAIAPEEKIFPPRTALALLGGMVAAGLRFLVLFLRRAAALTPSPEPPLPAKGASA